MRNVSTTSGIEFTRVNNDVNGNPRYVYHFLNFITDIENGYHDGEKYIPGTLGFSDSYNVAVKRANKIGGRKFHNKQYGGGIVFQSYNIEDLARRIKELKEQI